ncbi:hypothetical protein A6P39_044530 (plasmid) [Streptomyces sp. FXJ1.172]|nr:hypothetical protein [Streptomyces sp. FXJ1.172]WEP01088.1 hypothetical protein A6P39_044530 [Streptomyces sp. FXJ1.172]
MRVRRGRRVRGNGQRADARPEVDAGVSSTFRQVGSVFGVARTGTLLIRS